MLLCMMDLCDEEVNESAVRENTYMLLYEIESCVRKVFNKESIQQVTTGLRSTIKESAVNSEDVQFYWCMLTTDIEEEPAKSLPSMIIDL